MRRVSTSRDARASSLHQRGLLPILEFQPTPGVEATQRRAENIKGSVDRTLRTLTACVLLAGSMSLVTVCGQNQFNAGECVTINDGITNDDLE